MYSPIGTTVEYNNDIDPNNSVDFTIDRKRVLSDVPFGHNSANFVKKPKIANNDNTTHCWFSTDSRTVRHRFAKISTKPVATV